MRIPIKADVYRALSPEQRREADEALAELERVQRANPLALFTPHSEAQRTFLRATTSIIAAFAGNQFGKSTSLAVRSLRECLPLEYIPQRFQAGKRFGFDEPAHGWLLCPSNDKIYDSIFPALRKWAPGEALKGGNIDAAYDKQHRVLRFKRGDSIAFKTYEMEPATLGGATLHFIGYDEPPPQAHRDEAMTRLLIHDGYEMFAMTPLKVNTGWIRRDIFKQREDPDITVVRGAMGDNPLISDETRTRILARYANDIWRQAREYGDFINVGGLIYPDFGRCVLAAPPSPDEVRSWDIVVSIDPGIRNAGIVFEGFDRDNVCTIFDELLLQDRTPKDYANAIKQKLSRWGVKLEDVWFVIDPAARQRGQTNAETVMNLLAVEGIYCNAGQNDVDAGIAQGRTRMAHGRLKVSPECRGLCDEADDYAAQEPGEGKDDSHLRPIKGNDHRLDAARYGWMERVWDPVMEDQAPERMLGWTPGLALPQHLMQPRTPVGPMGSMG